MGFVIAGADNAFRKNAGLGLRACVRRETAKQALKKKEVVQAVSHFVSLSSRRQRLGGVALYCRQIRRKWRLDPKPARSATCSRVK
jgi:hypothetical protein